MNLFPAKEICTAGSATLTESPKRFICETRYHHNAANVYMLEMYPV